MEIRKRSWQLEGNTNNSTPFNLYQQHLWEVLRKEYPTDRNTETTGNIKMKDNERMLEYLKRATTMWEKHTGGQCVSPVLQSRHSGGCSL